MQHLYEKSCIFIYILYIGPVFENFRALKNFLEIFLPYNLYHQLITGQSEDIHYPCRPVRFPDNAV